MTAPVFFDFSGDFFSSSTIQARSFGINKVPDPSGRTFFDSDRLIVGDYGSLHFPILFQQEWGRKWDDILNTGFMGLYLISNRLRMILEENNLTGWKTFPIKLLDKKGNDVLGYHGFSITGRCGRTDRNKTPIQKRISEGEPLLTYYKGIHFNLDTWDNHDFFLPKGNTLIIITAKAADVLKKHKISNLLLKNLADIEIDEDFINSTEKYRNEIEDRPTFW